MAKKNIATKKTPLEEKKAKKKADALKDARDAAGTTLRLISTSFALVAGLAWNEVIKKFVETYIQRWFKDLGELIGLLIYAIIITIIVVFITNRLKKVEKRFKKKNEDEE